MSRESVLAQGRRRQETAFTETLTAYIATSTLNDEDGTTTPVETVVHADVRGRVKFPSMNVNEPEQGDRTAAVQDVHVHVAVGATPDVAVGVLWRVTASTADAGLIGAVWRTKGLPQRGQVTAWRYPVEEVS